MLKTDRMVLQLKFHKILRSDYVSGMTLLLPYINPHIIIFIFFSPFRVTGTHVQHSLCEGQVRKSITETTKNLSCSHLH